MSMRVSVILLSILLATTAGCSHQHAREIDARLESAENNAATARLRADEAYIKAEQAQRAADEASLRLNQITEKSVRKP